MNGGARAGPLEREDRGATVRLVGMRLLLVSTYELGHQPLHLAAPAAALRAAGHEVRTLDTSVEPWTREPVDLGRRRRRPSGVPARAGLPPLERYAHLALGGEERPVGYVEASHGCLHRCGHCPVPVVYDGRIRIVPADVVLADIESLVEAGARHITFGDPDFLN